MVVAVDVAVTAGVGTVVDPGLEPPSPFRIPAKVASTSVGKEPAFVNNLIGLAVAVPVPGSIAGITLVLEGTMAVVTGPAPVAVADVVAAGIGIIQ